MLEKYIISTLIIFLISIPVFSTSAKEKPSWLDNTRSQAQTGLSYGFLKKDSFYNASTELSKLQVRSYTRHVKLDWRPPLWPSKVPVSTDNLKPILEGQTDHLRSMIERANKNNIRLVAYYWDGGEGVPKSGKKGKLTHSSYNYTWSPPESWVCKDLSGKPILTSEKGKARGYHLDLSSDYKDFVLVRLKEMVERGVSGFYFDERHFPKATQGGCYGSATQEGYEKSGSIVTGNSKHKYLRFQSLAMVDTFSYWKKQIQSTFPKKDIPFIISGTYLSSYILPDMSLELAQVADSVKVEFSHGIRRSINGAIFKNNPSISRPPKDISLSIGWALPRDAASGRPPHIWKHNHKNLQELKLFISTIIGYGGISATHIPEQYLAGEREARNSRAGKPNFDTEYSVIRQGFKYSNHLSDIFAFSRPFKFAAIYLSEKHRDKFNTNIEVWKNVMKPVTATYESMIRAGLPVGFITDNNLNTDYLNNHKALFYIEDSLNKKEKKHLLLKSPNLVLIPIKNSYQKTYQKIINEISQKTIQLTPISPFRVISNPEDKVHSIFHQSKNKQTILISVLSDFEKLTMRKALSSKKKYIKVLFKNKPISIIDPLSKQELIIKKTNDSTHKYMIEINNFHNSKFLKVKF